MARPRPSRGKAGRDADRAPTGTGEPLAYRSPRALILFVGCGVVGLIADLWTKAAAFDALADRGGRMVLGRYLSLTRSTNPGIVFGIEQIPPWLVQVATVLAIAAVAVLFAGAGRRFWGLHAGLGMVLGGAAGNLYDRVFAKVVLPDGSVVTGHVRDFIDATIPIIDFRWPVFNVADVLLVVGLGMILLHVLGNRDTKPG